MKDTSNQGKLYIVPTQLFSNSQQEYAQTLLMIEGMESTFEAEDYFYKTLGWDKENPDVKDFMSIISAYFMGK